MKKFKLINKLHRGATFNLNGEKIVVSSDGELECSEENACQLLPLKNFTLAEGEEMPSDGSGVVMEGEPLEDETETSESDSEGYLEELAWADLRSLAKEHGLKTHGKKREEIEAEISEVI